MVFENSLRRNIRATFVSLITASTFLSSISLADDVFTSFEFNANGPFTVGASPISATFSAGVAETRGNAALYRTGLFAWHIRGGETAVVTFETPASALQFFTRTDRVGVTGQIRVFDELNVEILAQAPTNAFQAVNVTRAPGESLIGSVEIANQGGGDIVVDDFSFTADIVITPPPFDPNNPIPEQIANGGVQIILADIAPGLTAPNFGTFAPNHPSRLYVVDQPGQVIAIDLTTGDQSLFLDVSALLVPLGAFGPGTFDERGLLGLAFHPDYAQNGLLYTYSSEPIGAPADFSTIPAGSQADHQSVIREFVTPDPSDPSSTPDPAGLRELLRLDEPQFNHNAGALIFDENGYLLIAVGDGGGADDVDGQDFIGQPIIGHGTGNGQDPSNPFGAILRIDPLGANSQNTRYGIPTDNPFVGRAGFVEEIFAYGFRNPFRMSIDAQTGELYVADVGQNHIEELNIVNAGGNYGWNFKEGSFFFDPNGNGDGFVTDLDPGVPAGLIDPIAEYDHDEGISIIGGFVYRGNAIPALQGRFIFGEFGSFSADAGRLFYLDSTNRIQAFNVGVGGRLPFAVLGFGQDASGEVYVLGNTTGTPFDTTGVMQRLDAPPPPPPPPAPLPPPSGGGGGGSTGLLVLIPLLAVLTRRKTLGEDK